MNRVTPTQQSVVLLALVTSSLLTIKDSELLPELKETVETSAASMLDIIAEYRELSDPNEDVLETSRILTRVSEAINKSSDWFTTPVVVRLGYQICSDLLGEVCETQKRNLLNKAFTQIKALDDYVDPDGDDELTAKEVEGILEEVYKEIGFQTNLRYLRHSKKLQRRLKRHG